MIIHVSTAKAVRVDVQHGHLPEIHDAVYYVFTANDKTKPVQVHYQIVR